MILRKDELRALAERVERGAGEDRDIDHAIYAALNPTKPIPCDRRLLPWEHLYTTSLEAAMTLVPECYEWSVSWCGNSVANVSAIGVAYPVHCGAAPTPARALTAAALYALAEQEA